MLLLKWNGIRLLVGYQTTKGEYVLYYISGGKNYESLSNYIKLKADDNIISPVCSESVESLDTKLRYFLESTNKTYNF